jgi:malonyl CoA-acyl carrier protein transacylase
MGADLFDRYPDWTAEADARLGYSIRELCLDDPQTQLGLTEFTQPALYVVNAMTYRARQDDGKPAPAAVAGHSLGEFNALLAADVFDFGTGLRLVAERGRIMGQVRGGGMAAVIGLEPARIEQILSASEAGRRLDIANYNSYEQTVIAGPRDDLATVKPDFEAARARVIPIKVSAPFHSRYMQPAASEFARLLEELSWQSPRVPVVANVTGQPYPADALGETLGKQIDHAVRWLDSVRTLIDQGADEFEEVGPGAVLSKLVTQIRKRRRDE